jgi:hypothetical protein
MILGICAMFCLSGSIIGFVAAVILWTHHARRQQQQAFAALAPSLGLTLAGPHQMTGRVGRCTVEVVLTTERRRRHRRRRSVPVTRYWVRPPTGLRMGLKLHAQSAFFGDIAEAVGLVNDLRIGRDDVDGALRIGAADAAHAGAILRRDDVARAALAAAPLPRFYLRDDHAFAQHDGWLVSPQQFHQFATPLVQLVEALSAAREILRAHWEHELDAVWGRLAASEGFRYAASATLLTGATAGGTAVEVGVEYPDAGLATGARIRVARPLGLGLQLYRTGGMQNLGALFGAQDLRIGVPAIDGAFTIKATRAEEAQRLLASVGGELEILGASFGELKIDDAGLEARQPGLLTEPAQLSRTLRALARLAQALGGEPVQPPAAFR